MITREYLRAERDSTIAKAMKLDEAGHEARAARTWLRVERLTRALDLREAAAGADVQAAGADLDRARIAYRDARDYALVDRTLDAHVREFRARDAYYAALDRVVEQRKR